MSAITNQDFSDASGTVSTASTLALKASAQRQFLAVQNVHASNNFAFTVDGTAAVINGAGSFQCSPNQGFIFDTCVPTGIINVIGSASGTSYTIKYL